MIASAHDISEGGLFINLIEACFFLNLGFTAVQNKNSIRSDAWWFGEAQGRVVVSVKRAVEAEFEQSLNIPFEKIGEVTTGNISVNDEDWGTKSQD